MSLHPDWKKKATPEEIAFIEEGRMQHPDGTVTTAAERREAEVMKKRSGNDLIELGWRQIGRRGVIKYWDHPDHQPDRRGAFITESALKHQLEFEKNGHCDCVPREAR